MNGTLGTILVGIALAAILTAIVWKLIRDKKRGKSVICGGDCGSCGGACHGGCGGLTREEFEKLHTKASS